MYKIRNILWIICAFILWSNSIKAQEQSLSKWDFGCYYSGLMMPKPNVIIDYGDKVIKPTYHFGKEWGLTAQYILNEKFKLKLYLGKAQIDVNYYIDEAFAQNWAEMLNIAYTLEDIKKIRRIDKPKSTWVMYLYNNMDFKINYQVYQINFFSVDLYSGVSLICFQPSNRISDFTYLGIDENNGFNLPFHSEYSLNSYQITEMKVDVGLNMGIEINQRLKNYHTLGISLGLVWMPRYVLYSEYKVYTPDGLNQGSIIQSSSMLELKMQYSLNLKGISHYGEKK